MGNCVSGKDQEKEYKMERVKRRANEPTLNRGVRESSKALLAPPEEVTGTRRNLFKTFSDWSDETPVAEICKLQEQTRKRKGSATLCHPELKSDLKRSSLSDENKQHKSTSLTNSDKATKQKRQRQLLH